MYLALKHFTLFLLRSLWLITNSLQLQKKLFRILPHPINLLMILSGFAVVYSLGVSLSTPWILAKLIALVVYVVLGILTFKQTSKTRQFMFFSAALLTFVYICGVAVTKSPMSVLGFL
jgi:uncharacterized membrane protein SirB2